MSEPHQANPSRTFYSWIPNLTGSLNFEYISDNIVQDDDEYKLYQYVESATVKYFLYKSINFSDAVDKGKKGSPRNIICKMIKEESSLTGEYFEFVPKIKKPNPNESSLKLIYDNFEKNGIKENDLLSFDPDLYATFDIQLNGKIAITLNTINLILDDKGKPLSNIPLITYRAIKYILHKDIFHSEEDDNIIGVYSSEEQLKENILNNMLKYIKSYERLLKDNIKIYKDMNWVRQDFYNLLINKVEGILSYMSSFNYIIEKDSSKDYEYKVTLAKNVLDSMKSMIKELNNEFLSIVAKKDILTYGIALLVSMSLLTTGLLKSDLKPIDNFAYYIVAFSLTVLITVFVFKQYTISRVAFNRFIGDVHKSPEHFIKKRLTEYSNSPTRRAVIALVLGISLIFTASMMYFYPTELQKETHSSKIEKLSIPKDINLSLNEQNKTKQIFSNSTLSSEQQKNSN